MTCLILWFGVFFGWNIVSLVFVVCVLCDSGAYFVCFARMVVCLNVVCVLLVLVRCWLVILEFCLLLWRFSLGVVVVCLISLFVLLFCVYIWLLLVCLLFVWFWLCFSCLLGLVVFFLGLVVRYWVFGVGLFYIMLVWWLNCLGLTFICWWLLRLLFLVVVLTLVCLIVGLIVL